MSKVNRNKKKRQQKKEQFSVSSLPGGKSTIAFGEPRPIITSGTEYTQVAYNDSQDYWKTPIDRVALAQMPNLNGYHGGVLYARSNMICADYVGGGLSAEQLEAAVFDFLLFGDMAFLKVRNHFGQVISLEPLPSLYTRQRKEGEFVLLQEEKPLIFDRSDIVFLRKHDPQQQIYGLPDYIGGIHSALLNTEATVFRRKFLYRGGTTGYILYTTDANITAEVEAEIKKKIEQENSIGNFNNIFINIPKGDPEGVKVIDFTDKGAKDEFNAVKSVTSKDILAAHRFPPGLAGIFADGVNLPDPETSRDTYRKDEVIPVQRKIANAVKADPEIPAHLWLEFSSL